MEIILELLFVCWASQRQCSECALEGYFHGSWAMVGPGRKI